VGLPWTFHKLGCPCLEPPLPVLEVERSNGRRSRQTGAGTSFCRHRDDTSLFIWPFPELLQWLKWLKKYFRPPLFRRQTETPVIYPTKNNISSITTTVFKWSWKNVEVTTTVIKEWERYTRKFALSSYADPVNHVCTSQAKPPISVKGKSQRAEARCPKGRERGWSWRGQPAPSPPGTPTAKRFSCIL